MSFKEIIENPLAWAIAVGNTIGWLLLRGKRTLDNNKLSIDTKAASIETEIKARAYNKAEFLNTEKERDDYKALNRELMERVRLLEIEVKELTARFNLFKTINA